MFIADSSEEGETIDAITCSIIFTAWTMYGSVAVDSSTEVGMLTNDNDFFFFSSPALGVVGV